MEAYLFIFLAVFVGHVQSEWCHTGDDYTYKSCQHGCCGSIGDPYCCSTYSDITVYPVYGVGPIVGIVIGSLAGLGILISIIVCCCCRPCGRSTSGQVLQPHTNPAFPVSTVTTTNGATMPMTQLTPGMYAPSYPTFPQMAGSYLPGNAVMNYPHGVTQSMNNPRAAPPPDYDYVANK